MNYTTDTTNPEISIPIIQTKEDFKEAWDSREKLILCGDQDKIGKMLGMNEGSFRMLKYRAYKGQYDKTSVMQRIINALFFDLLKSGY